MTEISMTSIELLQKHDEGDFLRAVTEAVLQTLMEHDVEGLIGAGRYERGDGRQTWRNGLSYEVSGFLAIREPQPGTPNMLGCGGGRIENGLVVTDRAIV